MAACGSSLHHIFKKPLPENPTLLESLSCWNQIKTTKPIVEDSSFTEIFGELHFKENPEPSFPPSSSSNNNNEKITINPSPDFFSITNVKQFPKKSDSFSSSSMNSESLQLCTEGLGFESSADVEDLKSDTKIADWGHDEGGKMGIGKQNLLRENFVSGELMRRGRKISGEFPPPISCIGESGKPWVCFKSYRQNGRFVLKEIRVPNQEFLHASREDGRLKLQFFQAEEEEEEEGGGGGKEEEEDEEEEEESDGDEEEEEDGENNWPDEY